MIDINDLDVNVKEEMTEEDTVLPVLDSTIVFSEDVGLKREQQRALTSDVEDYLARGGNVTVLPMGDIASVNDWLWVR